MDTPTSSRLVGQAAAATQAGLSADDEGEDSAASSGPQIDAQAQRSAVIHAVSAPTVASVPLPSPQLANAAIPAPPAAPIASTRGGTPTPTRTSEPDTQTQPTTPSPTAISAIQPSPATTSDLQPLPTILPATSALVATNSAAATRPAQATTPAPSPAAQVAQVIAEPVKVVLTSPIQTGSTTPHVTTIQITPAELGRVDVRIERTDAGPAKIQLVAERPETLSRLVHDQSQLQQALDHAGIPQNSRTIEFSLAPATTDGNAFSTNLSGNNASGGEASGNGFARSNSGYYNQSPNDAENDNLGSTTQSRVVRTGIDITA